jgi:hypothetical protein
VTAARGADAACIEPVESRASFACRSRGPGDLSVIRRPPRVPQSLWRRAPSTKPTGYSTRAQWVHPNGLRAGWGATFAAASARYTNRGRLERRPLWGGSFERLPNRRPALSPSACKRDRDAARRLAHGAEYPLSPIRKPELLDDQGVSDSRRCAAAAACAGSCTTCADGWAPVSVSSCCVELSAPSTS